MSIVDKETFAYWVTHPHDIGAPNLSRLEDTAQAFPYCQITYSLLAKVGCDTNAPQVSRYISQAAINTLNRAALRRLIENEFAWSESLLNRLADLPMGKSYSREKAAPYGHDKPISLIRFENRFDKNSEPFDRADSHEVAPKEKLQMDETVATEKAIEEDLTHKRPIFAPIPVIELIPLPTPKEDERRKQQEIIEAFIKNDPRIGPIRPKIQDEIEPVDLSVRAKSVPVDGLATESFAKILVKQGKIDKAIGIYEKLMLKNPEKKDYFAKKIEELN